MRSIITTILAIIVALAILVIPAAAQVDRVWPGRTFADWGWRHMVFGSATMILVWVGITLLIILLLRSVGALPSSRESMAAARQTALEVLRERYARGEIDKREFEERKLTLSAR
ncbi:MAG TPA: SHOCT domain-containing protein [Bauldia sp.]|nr:SHOCT domain-containing protein [Bauldia sp.]